MSEHIDHETGEIVEVSAPRLSTPQVPQMMPLASMDVGVDQVCAALAKAQGEFEAPKRTKPAKISGQTRDGRSYEYKYMYAPLEEIIRAVQKPMAEAGLSRQQYLVSRGNQWFVRTIIWHLSGQWISSDYPVFPEANTGPKFAAAVTYAKRQGLSLAVCLSPEDDLDAEDSEPVDASGGQEARKAPATRKATVSQEGPPTVSAANGSGIPEGIRQFFERPSYVIDRAKVSGWEQWGTQYLRVLKHAGIEQCLKLRLDNKANMQALAAASDDDRRNIEAGMKSDGHAEIHRRFTADVTEFERRLKMTAEPVA
jgi:hypothetical protein